MVILLLLSLGFLWNLSIDPASRICRHPFKFLIIFNLLIMHLLDVLLEILDGSMQALLLNLELLSEFLLHDLICRFLPV